MTDFKLGKQDYKHDDRTMRLMRFAEAAPPAPDKFDFDAHRKPLPSDNAWGNYDYGDCVVAAQANDLVRKERVETHRSIKLTADMAITRYKRLTGCQSPGDAKDTGLVMLDTFGDWRGPGWPTPLNNNRVYHIDAYGELTAQDRAELRAGVFLLGGVHFGLALPRSASAQVDSGEWTVTTGPGSEPGSWGGHAVFAQKYDEGGIYCITWDREVYMTNDFIETYADEAWATVDSLDAHSHWLDVAKMNQYLRDIGAKIN